MLYAMPQMGDVPEPRRVFISHTSELRMYPAARSFVAAAESAISRAGDAIVDMAYFAANTLPPAQLCRDVVLQSEVLVLIAGFRYGSPVRDRPEVSYSELEFEAAGEAGIPQLVFIIDEAAEGPALLFLDPDYGARQGAFRTRLRNGSVTAEMVTSPDQLETAVLHALSSLPRSESRARDPRTEGSHDRADLEAHFIPRAHGVEPFGELTGWYFCGRARVMAQIIGWLAEPSDGDVRARLITGGPGSGKSAILGRLVVMSNPRLRARVPQEEFDRAPTGTICPEGAITGQVHARGLTVDEVGVAVAAELGIDAHDGTSLLLALAEAESPNRRVLVVDAVDESATADILVRALLVPLARLARRTGLRMIIGSRPGPEHRLIRAFGRSAVELDLDSAGFADQEDLREYAERLLTSAGENRLVPTPYSDRPDIARAVGRAIARRAGYSFLVAHLSSLALSQADVVVDTDQLDWESALPSSADEAMDHYLAGLEPDRTRVQDLLTPLAFTAGNGIDDVDVWAGLATALGTASYSGADVRWLLSRPGGSDLLSRTELIDGQDSLVCYRPFHEAMAEYLRQSILQTRGGKAVASSFADTLVRAVPLSPHGGGRQWSRASRYIRCHLSTHAAEAGILDQLLTDLLFVATAEPSRLLAAAHKTTTPDGRRVSAAMERVGRQFLLFPDSERLSYLELAAQKMRDSRLVDQIAAVAPGRPWSVPWAHWLATSSGRTIGHHGRYIAGMVLLINGQSTTIAIYDRTSIHLWDPISEHSIGMLDHPGLADIMTAASVSTDAGPRITTGHADGALVFWNPENGDCSIRQAVSPESAADIAVASIGHNMVIVGGKDGIATVWRAGDAMAERCVILPAGWRIVTASRLDDIDYALLIDEGERFVRFWNLVSGQVIGESVEILGGTELWACALGVVGDMPVAFVGISGGRLKGNSACLIGGPRPALQANIDAGWGPMSAVFTRRACPPRLSIGGADGLIRRFIWEGSRFVAAETVVAHENDIEALRFLEHDGVEFEISGSRDGAIRAWPDSVHVESSSPVVEMRSDSHIVAQAADGQVIVGQGRDQIARWSTKTGRELGPLVGSAGTDAERGKVTAMAHAQVEGRPLVIAGYSDGSITVYHLETGEVLSATSVGSPVDRLRVAGPKDAAGPVLVCASGGAISTFDLARSVWIVRDRMVGGGAPEYFAIDVVEVDGHRLAVTVGTESAVGSTTILRAWDIDEDRITYEASAAIASRVLWCVAAGYLDGRGVAVAMGEGSALCVWDLQTENVVESGYLDDGHRMATHHVSIERIQGRDVILSGGHAGALSIWAPRGRLHVTIELGYTVSGWCALGPNAIIAGGARGFARVDIARSIFDNPHIRPAEIAR